MQSKIACPVYRHRLPASGQRLRIPRLSNCHTFVRLQRSNFIVSSSAYNFEGTMIPNLCTSSIRYLLTVKSRRYPQLLAFTHREEVSEGSYQLFSSAVNEIGSVTGLLPISLLLLFALKAKRASKYQGSKQCSRVPAAHSPL